MIITSYISWGLINLKILNYSKNIAKHFKLNLKYIKFKINENLTQIYPALPILGWTWTYQEFTNFHCYLFSIGRVNPELYALGAGTWKLEGIKVGSYLNPLEQEEWMQNYVNVLCINSWQVYDKQLSLFSMMSMPLKYYFVHNYNI